MKRRVGEKRVAVGERERVKRGKEEEKGANKRRWRELSGWTRGKRKILDWIKD